MSYDEEDHPEDEFRREWDKREREHAREIERLTAAAVESMEKQFAIIAGLRGLVRDLTAQRDEDAITYATLRQRLEAWIEYGESDAHPGHHDLCELNGGGYEPECDCPANTRSLRCKATWRDGRCSRQAVEGGDLCRPCRGTNYAEAYPDYAKEYPDPPSTEIMDTTAPTACGKDQRANPGLPGKAGPSSPFTTTLLEGFSFAPQPHGTDDTHCACGKCCGKCHYDPCRCHIESAEALVRKAMESLLAQGLTPQHTIEFVQDPDDPTKVTFVGTLRNPIIEPDSSD